MSTRRICISDPSDDLQFAGKWSTLDVAELGIEGASCSQVMSPIDNQTAVNIAFDGSMVSVFAAYILSDNGTTPIVLTGLDNSSASAAIPLGDSTNGTVLSIYDSPSLAAQHHAFQMVIALPHNTAFYLDSYSVTTGSDGHLQSNGDSSTSPIGPIVGGVVGGIVLVVCSVLAFYYLYWNKRHTGLSPEAGFSFSGHDKDFENVDESLTPLISARGAVSPFTVTAPTFAPDAHSQPNETEMRQSDRESQVTRRPTEETGYSPSLSQASSSTTSNLRVMNPASEHRTADAVVTNTGGTKFSEAYRSRSMQATVLHHQDSGIRFNPAGESSRAGPSTEPVIEDVPPIYTES